MACGSCAERARKRKLAEQMKMDNSTPQRVYASSNVVKNTPAKVVEASKTNEKVMLRYYGGGHFKYRDSDECIDRDLFGTACKQFVRFRFRSRGCFNRS